MILRSIAILTTIVLILGITSHSFPNSFALTSGAPVKPHSQGTPVNQNKNQGEQGPSAAGGGNGFGTGGVQRQPVSSGGGEQGPSPAGGGNGFGTGGVQRQTIPNGGGEQGPSAAGGGNGFNSKIVKQNQNQKGNQGTQTQKCLGPIISVSTPSATDNYIWVDNMGPWRSFVSNLHVTSGSHYITIDRYSYETGNLIQHLVRVGYTDNCHPYTFRMS